jgi:hypothetical protein
MDFILLILLCGHLARPSHRAREGLEGSRLRELGESSDGVVCDASPAMVVHCRLIRAALRDQVNPCVPMKPNSSLALVGKGL